MTLFAGYTEVLKAVLLAFIPLVAILGVAQFTFLHLPGRRIIAIAEGLLLAFVGLTLFLQGVNVGYIPIGRLLGYQLADLPYNWILVPIGLFFGFAVTLTEPAVYVLTQVIENATAGFVRRKLLLTALALGVAISVALGMLKLLLGIPLWYIIVPGYVIALVFARFVDPVFVSIAFDSGGVATGTMTATFMTALAIGAATRLEATDPLLDGFGIISIVALVPILTVLLLGFVVRSRQKSGEEQSYFRETEDGSE